VRCQYGKVAERFPDRATAKRGMRTTCAIQVKRLAKTDSRSRASRSRVLRGTRGFSCRNNALSRNEPFDPRGRIGLFYVRLFS
jgi:hypothetical protein